MQLEKFYFDVVAASGEGCVGYALRLPEIGITIAATLDWPAAPDGEVVQRRTVRGTLPVVRANPITWRCPALQVDGRWSARAAPIQETLWRDGGTAFWQVLAPSAEATVQLGDRTISGLGYVERLTLDLSPWRLPLHTLRWGRFVSPEHNVVWIRWEHAAPRQWLWHNGKQFTPTAIDGTAVTWLDHQLAFVPRRTLREGRLGRTALSGWGRVQRLIPGRLQMLDESKWCAEGRLIGPVGVIARGWVIHESVRFR